MIGEKGMWRVWLIVNPAHALFYSSAVATLVAVVVHLHVFHSPLTADLLKPLYKLAEQRGWAL